MMKSIFLSAILVLLSIGCAQQTELVQVEAEVNPVSIPDQTIDMSRLTYDNKRSIWTLDSALYSGYGLSLYPDSSLQQKIGFVEGKKQNRQEDWYPDGHLKSVAHYHRGKLHGEKKSWSAEAAHILLSHLNYHLGKAHGEQRLWYQTGEIFKVLNLAMGKEEGIQQAYRRNGKLFANYEVKNGRVFGLKRAALCFELQDENVQYAK